MARALRLLGAGTLVALLAASLAPAQEPRLNAAGPEPGVVKLGDRAKVDVSLENADQGELLPPDPVAGLDIQVTSPRSSQHMIIVNGRVRENRSVAWTVFLTPAKEGNYTIPPFRARVGGRTIQTAGALRLEVVKDLTGEKYAFIEIETARSSYFMHEPVRVVIRFGIDETIVRNLVQLDARLDFNVHVQAPWLAELPGAVTMEQPINEGRAISLAVNREIGRATRGEARERGGRRFTTYEIERTFLPVRSGSLTFTGPLISFKVATNFSRSVFGELVVTRWEDAHVYAQPRELAIRPIPEAGRPPSFTGAVGRFTVRASAAPRELKVGESLKVTLTIEGEGNLEFLEPPRLDDLKGFHVFGKLEEKSRDRRVVTYDLSPLADDVKELPAIPFSFFDTREPAGFKTVTTQPIPLTVKPVPESARLRPLPGDGEKRAIPGVDDIFDMKPVTGTAAGSADLPAPGVVAAALGGPWLLFAAGLALRRRRARDRADPAAVRSRGALAALRGALATDGADLAEVLAAFVGAKLRVPAAAVIAPDLPQRLRAAGVPADLAVRVAAMLDQLVAARYVRGGGAMPPREPIVQLAGELDAALAGRRAP